MKAIIISLCLLVPMHAHSAFCSEAATDEPCTPDGPDTDRRKSEILTSIKKAQDLEAEVEGLRRIALSQLAQRRGERLFPRFERICPADA